MTEFVVEFLTNYDEFEPMVKEALIRLNPETGNILLIEP